MPALKKYFPHLEIFIKKLDDARVQIICENRHSIILALHHQSASPPKKIWEGNNISDNGKILIILQLLLCAYDYQNISESAMNDIFSFSGM